MKPISMLTALLGLTGLLLLPALAQAQTCIPYFEFSSVAVVSPAASSDIHSLSLQGAAGQTFATISLPADAGQTLALAGFSQTAVPFAYKGSVFLEGFTGDTGRVLLTAELFNTLDGSRSDSLQGYADSSGHFTLTSWANPAFIGSIRLSGANWLPQRQTLTLPADSFAGYPQVDFSLMQSAISGDESTDGR